MGPKDGSGHRTSNWKDGPGCNAAPPVLKMQYIHPCSHSTAHPQTPLLPGTLPVPRPEPPGPAITCPRRQAPDPVAPRQSPT